MCFVYANNLQFTAVHYIVQCTNCRYCTCTVEFTLHTLCKYVINTARHVLITVRGDCLKCLITTV